MQVFVLHIESIAQYGKTMKHEFKSHPEQIYNHTTLFWLMNRK